MSYVGNTPFTAAFLTDTFSGNGSTVAFTMSVAPATTSSVIVAITGVLQDPSTYSVSGTTLTFSAAPPTGTSNISVRYLGIPASGVTTTAYRTQTEFTATAGQTTFSVPSYTVGFIDVYRNGLLLGSSDFTATNGTTVVLANAASAGDFVEAVSFYVSSVLNALPNTGGTLSGNLVVNGDETISGNVGIGTASPNSKLEVTSRITASDGGGASRIALNIESNTSAQTYSAINSYNYGTSTARNLVLNESGGNVGIGTISPSATLTVNGGAQFVSTAFNSNGITLGTTVSSFDWRIADSGASTYALTFGSVSSGVTTERMRITSTGSLLVGNTVSPTSAGNAGVEIYQSAGIGGMYFGKTYSGSTDAQRFYYNGGGSAVQVGSINYTNTATSFNTSSDYRLKENIQPMTGALAKVQALNPVTYTWKADGSDGEGFIAHELQAVVPDAVTGEKDGTRIEQYEVSPAVPATYDEDGNELTPSVEAVIGEREVPKYQGIDTSFLVATLTAAIQELKALVDTQASTITQLQADVAALKGNS